MSRLVFYRKYRPQRFGEIIGQEHVVRTLTNALSRGEVAHAYLFSGPRGTGKTTIARLIAKAVNCEAAPEAEPCNLCSFCEEISQGRALDLVEIDAASHRGIEEVRELREMTRVAPARAKFRVFIIDEAHMLTREAFNALLKTLEEPPSHVIFILATTEVHRLPATIISRCQRFDFKRLRRDEILNRLERIAREEKFTLDPDALKLIALSSDGSARDAESLLSQIATFGEKHITKKDVERILGVVDEIAIEEFVGYLARRETSHAVSLLNRIAHEGYDMEQLTRSLIQYTRSLLIFSLNPESRDSLLSEFEEEKFETFENVVRQLSQKDLSRLIELFLIAGKEVKNAVLPQLPLELAVVEFLQKSEK